MDRVVPIQTKHLESTPFKVRIPDGDLEQLEALLDMTPIAQSTFESSLPDGRRTYGVQRNWLVNAVEEWKHTFDWRKHEAHMNTFDHFHMTIDDSLGDFHVHYIAMLSKKQSAIPLISLHGWPGSFLEFLPLMDKMRKKYDNLETLPYHIIVPSLPGYAFSSPPPIECDFGIEDVARLMNQLMVNLGFQDGYMVQGGDVGSKVARVMAAKHDECKAIHINFCIMEDEPKITSGEVTEAEKTGLIRAREFLRTGSAYAIEHATKPSTIGFVLASNPVSLLVWIGEKFLAWTDQDPPLSLILESVSLYWFSNCVATSLWPYRIFYTPGVNGNPHNMMEYKIPGTKPFGYSFYPFEIYPVPQSWAATTGNLTFFRSHDKGGHFAAVEQTEAFMKDLEDFVQESRVAAGFDSD